MPVRRKTNRRRSSAPPEAWETALETGFDLFDDLPDYGIQTDQYGRPDREAAEAAWRALGHALLERWTVTRRHIETPAWALTEFGEPQRSSNPIHIVSQEQQ
ncbi:MAG: hypothetical protein QHC90_23190 [Shinella sp.]|nr:hypothetical protein [Shinella sp.]